MTPTKWTICLAFAALAACGPGGSKPADNFKGVTFYRGNAAEPETLDPSLALGNYEDNIMGDMLVGLMTYDTHAQPIPGIAKSWTTSADGLTWIFKLRDAVWSDGAPVTADDFVFSWQRILNPKTAAQYAYFLYVLKNAKPVNTGKMPLSALGAHALDPHTLQITLEHPAPYLLQMLAHMTMYPEPRRVVKAKGNAWTKPGNYVSDGPYTLKDWVPNDHITLIKNPKFYDAENVKVDRVIFYPTSDYSAALRRFRAGELDEQDALPSAQIDWLRAHLPQTMHPVPQLTVEFIAANESRKPFDDVRVRKAINLAINREVITQKIGRMGEPPAYSFVPPGILNFPHDNAFDFKNTPYPERLAEAQALMRAAGFGPQKRLRTTFMVRSTSMGSGRAMAAAIQQMLGTVYVDISIVPNDAAIFYDMVEQHDFDLAEAGWIADFNDASNFLDLLRTGNGNNYGEYSNPAYDTMLDAAQNDTDLISRGKKLAAAEAIAIHDQAWIPLYFGVSADLVWPYVKGWVPNAVDFHRTRWVSIDEAARARQFPKQAY